MGMVDLDAALDAFRDVVGACGMSGAHLCTLRTRACIWPMLAGVIALVLPEGAAAADMQCLLGVTRCVKSQGTEIPSSRVLEILSACADFTAGNVGRSVLTLTHKEISDRAGGRLTPLVMAWHAFGDLRGSPLAFERKRNAEDTNYLEIKRSCDQLLRDFNNDARWTK